MAGVFKDFGGNVAKRSGKGGELLVGGVEAFWAAENEHRSGERRGDMYAKVNDDNVAARVLEAVEDDLWSATSVKGETEWRAQLRSQWTML